MCIKVFVNGNTIKTKEVIIIKVRVGGALGWRGKNNKQEGMDGLLGY